MKRNLVVTFQKSAHLQDVQEYAVGSESELAMILSLLEPNKAKVVEMKLFEASDPKNLQYLNHVSFSSCQTQILPRNTASTTRRVVRFVKSLVKRVWRKSRT